MLEARNDSQAERIAALRDRIRELEAKNDKLHDEMEHVEQIMMSARRERDGIARNLLIVSAIAAIRKARGRNRRHRK